MKLHQIFLIQIILITLLWIFVFDIYHSAVSAINDKMHFDILFGLMSVQAFWEVKNTDAG